MHEIFFLLGCYAAFIGSYRRLGTTSWSHLQGSGLLDALRWNKYLVPKYSVLRMIPDERRWVSGSHFVSKTVAGSAASHYVPAFVPRHINFYDPTGTDLAALSLN